MIRELAAVADEAGVRMAIYPHAGHYTATALDALPWSRKSTARTSESRSLFATN